MTNGDRRTPVRDNLLITVHRPLIILLALVSNTAFRSTAEAQSFQNLDFASRCDTCATQLTHWRISWSGSGTRCIADHGALLIDNPGDAVGFVEQPAFVGDTGDLKVLTITAHVRSEGVEGKGAGLNVGVYDAEGGLVFNKDMGYASFSWITGTKDWRTVSVKAICPAGATRVNLGLILYGKGKAWFDDLHVSVTSTRDRKAGPEATAYVNAACDSIRMHSLRRDSIDLPALRQVALRIAGDANDPGDHHLAVEYLLSALGDHHSFLMKPEEVIAWQGQGEELPAVEFAQHRVIQDCGYLLIPAFASIDTSQMEAFADTIQQALHDLYLTGVKGWIIDMRQNTGGNMTPMIAGLGPLLDEGTLGGLRDVNGKAERWSYRDGALCWDSVPGFRVPHPVTLATRLPIEVLIGQRTGSSGEFTTVSFVGNAHTRLIGEPTWGLTTGNGEFSLPDGARMFMASTVMMDRKGRRYHGPIQPEVRAEQPLEATYDVVLQTAIDHILGPRDK